MTTDSMATLSAATIIWAADLCKTFRILKRQPGFVGAIRNLFSTDYEGIKAVDKVSFEITPGELVGYVARRRVPALRLARTADGLYLFGIIAVGLAGSHSTLSEHGVIGSTSLRVARMVSSQ
jgi:hypothetical protein